MSSLVLMSALKVGVWIEYVMLRFNRIDRLHTGQGFVKGLVQQVIVIVKIINEFGTMMNGVHHADTLATKVIPGNVLHNFVR